MTKPNKKPLILSIETSGATCGVVLSEGEKFLAEYSLFGNNLHDRLLAELSRRIMDDCEKSFDELSAVAVSAGPGSFTGLRIGISVAKGICFSGGIKCIAVPTLSAFASAATEFVASIGVNEIITVVQSNQNNIFMQRFDSQGIVMSEIKVMESQEVQKYLSDSVVLCGTAAGDFQTNAHRLSGLNRLTPRFIARLAVKLYAEGKWVEPEQFIPLYVQEFQLRNTVKKITTPSAL